MEMMSQNMTMANYENTLDERDGINFDISFGSIWLYMILGIFVVCCGVFVCRLCGSSRVQKEGGEIESE